MTTVQELIEELRRFPADANCYVRGGDSAVLVVISPDGGRTLGQIATGSAENRESGGVEILY